MWSYQSGWFFLAKKGIKKNGIIICKKTMKSGVTLILNYKAKNIYYTLCMYTYLSIKQNKKYNIKTKKFKSGYLFLMRIQFTTKSFLKITICET